MATRSTRAQKRIAEAIKVDSQTPSLTRGVIAAVRGTDAIDVDQWTVDVFIDGSLNATENVSYFASYSPTVGETVWVLMMESEPIVLGKLCDGAAGNYPLNLMEYDAPIGDRSFVSPAVNSINVPSRPHAVITLTAGRLYRLEATIAVSNPHASQDVTLDAYIVYGLNGGSLTTGANAGLICKGETIAHGGTGAATDHFNGFGFLATPNGYGDVVVAEFAIGLVIRSTPTGDIKLWQSTDVGTTWIAAYDAGPA